MITSFVIAKTLNNNVKGIAVPSPFCEVKRPLKGRI